MLVFLPPFIYGGGGRNGTIKKIQQRWFDHFIITL